MLGKGRRPRAVPFGRKTADALRRSLRVRRAHSAADRPNLWLSKNGALAVSGLAQVLERRGNDAGVEHARTPAPIPAHLRACLAVGGQSRPT